MLPLDFLLNKLGATQEFSVQLHSVPFFCLSPCLSGCRPRSKGAFFEVRARLPSPAVLGCFRRLDPQMVYFIEPNGNIFSVGPSRPIGNALCFDSRFNHYLLMIGLKYDQFVWPDTGLGRCEELGGFLSMFMPSGR